jgi:hypothetical protein
MTNALAYYSAASVRKSKRFMRLTPRIPGRSLSKVLALESGKAARTRQGAVTRANLASMQ